MKAKASERAAAHGTDLGSYVRHLIATDLDLPGPRKSRRKHDELRKELARLHAAIIACVAQIEANQGHLSDLKFREPTIMMLQDAVAALLAVGSRR